jgi:hypothetical protein
MEKMKYKKNIRYFKATGEILLEIIKQVSSNIPEDAELIKIEPDIPTTPQIEGSYNIIRFLIVSEEFPKLNEAECIPFFVPKMHYDKVDKLKKIMKKK